MKQNNDAIDLSHDITGLYDSQDDKEVLQLTDDIMMHGRLNKMKQWLVETYGVTITD